MRLVYIVLTMVFGATLAPEARADGPLDKIFGNGKNTGTVIKEVSKGFKEVVRARTKRDRQAKKLEAERLKQATKRQAIAAKTQQTRIKTGSKERLVMIETRSKERVVAMQNGVDRELALIEARQKVLEKALEADAKIITMNLGSSAGGVQVRTDSTTSAAPASTKSVRRHVHSPKALYTEEQADEIGHVVLVSGKERTLRPVAKIGDVWYYGLREEHPNK